MFSGGFEHSGAAAHRVEANRLMWSLGPFIRGRNMKRLLLAAFVGVVLAAAPACGQEALGPATGNVADLAGGFPTLLEDTTTAPLGSITVGIAGGYLTNGTSIETALIEVNYGLLENLELSADWLWVVGSGRIAGNGDTYLSALWAPIAEDGYMPSMGLSAGARLPSGDGFTGYDGTIVGVVTKTIGQVRVHLNAAYTTIGNSLPGIKSDADAFALGMDCPIVDGLVLVADVFSLESPLQGGDRVQGVEAGVRAALTEKDTLSVGVSVGDGAGNVTPKFTAAVGYQRAL